MHFVEVVGTLAEIESLGAGTELVLKPSGAQQVGAGRRRVGGYASDGMIAELRARGLDVTVVLSDVDRAAALRQLLEPGS
jgi:hypothetical protein